VGLQGVKPQQTGVEVTPTPGFVLKTCTVTPQVDEDQVGAVVSHLAYDIKTRPNGCG
jgi:hypothetical protein